MTRSLCPLFHETDKIRDKEHKGRVVDNEEKDRCYGVKDRPLGGEGVRTTLTFSST